MKIICVIPARLKSTRMHEKMLHVINGKSLIQHTWECASKVKIFTKVVIAVDCIKLQSHVLEFTDNCILTSSNHKSGTSRMLEVYDILSSQDDFYDLWINWQGDEPFININLINELINSNDSSNDIFTLKSKIFYKEDLIDNSNVKVITDINNKSIYFSRLPIPYNKNILSANNCNISLLNYNYYKHIGIYMFKNSILTNLKYILASSSFLEDYENLEQLSFLYHGLKIKCITTNYKTHGIDTLKDIIILKDKL
jgi:3-deoxy-manno-octulosonate cytidylyltransferase (CMP-KDO synthetase)